MTIETRIFLVRHGQTQWNLQNRLQGHADSPLTADGRDQASSAGNSLAREVIHGAYASPLKRAWNTAQIILQDRGIELVGCCALKEIRLGPWEGKTLAETEQSDPVQHHRFWNCQHGFTLPGAETFQQLQTRMVKALDTVFTQHKAKNILVVSHQIAIKTAIAHYTNTPLQQLAGIPYLENGRFFTISRRDNDISVY